MLPTYVCCATKELKQKPRSVQTQAILNYVIAERQEKVHARNLILSY